MDFVDRLKALKAEKNMTSKEIANLSGVPESTVSRIISKRTPNPSFLDVIAIVRAMGGSLDAIADLHPQRKSDDELLKRYEDALERKDRQLRRLNILFYAIVAAIIILFLVDAFVGTIGYIRH